MWKHTRLNYITLITHCIQEEVVSLSNGEDCDSKGLADEVFRAAIRS